MADPADPPAKIHPREQEFHEMSAESRRKLAFETLMNDEDEALARAYSTILGIETTHSDVESIVFSCVDDKEQRQQQQLHKQQKDESITAADASISICDSMSAASLPSESPREQKY